MTITESFNANFPNSVAVRGNSVALTDPLVSSTFTNSIVVPLFVNCVRTSVTNPPIVIS